MSEKKYPCDNFVIRRGSTPTLIFKSPISLDDLIEVFVTCKQFNKTIIEKNIDDVVFEDQKIKVRLEQTDTLALSTLCNAAINVRGKYRDGTCPVSQIFYVPVGEVGKEGVI